MQREILVATVVLLFMMATIVPLTTITTVNAEDWMDRLGRVLFGRHNDYLDCLEGKITIEEFNQRQKVREATWKALGLGVRCLTELPYMGSPSWAADKILDESGLYDDGSTQKNKDDLGGINFSYSLRVKSVCPQTVNCLCGKRY